MAIEGIKKVHIVGHSQHRDSVVGLLQKLGLVEITDLKEIPTAKDYEEFLVKEELRDEELERRAQNLEYAINYLANFEARGGFLKTLLPSKPMVEPEELRQVIERFDDRAVYESCRRVEEDWHGLEEEERRLRAQYEALLPWRALNLALEDIGPTGQTYTWLGVVPASSFDTLCEALSRDCPQTHVEVVDDGPKLTYLMVTYHRLVTTKAQELLKRYGFTRVEFPHLMGRPSSIIDEVSREIERVRAELRALEAKAKELAKARTKLMVLCDYLLNRTRLKKIQNYFAQTRSTFMIEGWIRRVDVKRLEDRLLKKFMELEITVTDPARDEVPPVELTNRRLIRPFEMVTNIFGLPSYNELDPTPLLAPFFMLFFGLCLTDAGYGVILALLAWVGLKKLKLGEGARRLLRLLFLAGIAAVCVGLLTGGIFGIDFEQLPHRMGWLRRLRDGLIIFDPLKNIRTFLVVCLGLGFLQVWFGFLLRLYKEMRRGYCWGAILTHAPWLVLLPGLLAFGLTKAGILGETWAPLAKMMSILGAVGIVLFHGKEKRNIFARLGMGLFGLYGIIGVFGDILSYLRLVALGLATSVIAMVVNMIAGLAWGVPVVGYVFGFCILVVGHLFNLAINTLCGFIHTARLQFVEFFTKFYEGGGRPFKPFCEETRYTIVRGEV